MIRKMRARFERPNVEVRGRRRGVASTLFVVFFTITVAAYALAGLVPALVTAAVGLLIALAGSGWKRRGTLRVEQDAITLDGRMLVERRGVRVATSRNVATLRGSGLVVRLGAEGDARALDEAIAPDPEHELDSTRLEASWAPTTLGLVGRVGGMVAVGVPMLIAFVLPPRPVAQGWIVFGLFWTLAQMVVFFVWMNAQTGARFIVGEEGLMVYDALRPPRWVSYDGLEVEASRYTVEDRTTRIDLRFDAPDWSGSYWARADRVDDAERLVGAIEAAKARRSEREEQEGEDEAEEGESREPPWVAPLLERGTLTAREWIARLRGLGAGRGAFREAAPPRAALLEVVTRADIGAELRVAAAVALRDTLDDDERARIRVALEEDEAAERVRARVAEAIAPEASDARLEALLDDDEEDDAGDATPSA